LLLHAGKLDLSPGNTRLIAGLLAVLVAWWTKNTLITILVGMALLVALQFTI
jgi:branched-subunit amino acid transport protein